MVLYGMAQPTVELAAELKITDAASASLSKINSGLKSVSSQFDNASKGALSFIKNAASTAVGVQFAGVGGSIKAAMTQAFDAALDVAKQQKEIAAALMMTDKTGASYDELKKHAEGLHGEMQELGIKAGVSADAVTDAYADIAARTTKTEEQLKGAMTSMVEASRALPGGLSSLTSGFQMMEMGMIRARNPVVQLVAASGLLKGNARAVAKEMMKMKPEDALKIGEQAIERMAQRMKKVPLGYGAALQSMKDMQQNIYETMGAGILKGMSPVMRVLRDEFLAHRGDIDNFANRVGKTVQEWSKEGVVKLKEAFAWLDSNWEAIADGFKKAADAMFAAVKFIVDHKEVIAGAFLVHQGSQLAPGAAKLGSAALNAGTAAAGGFIKMGAAEAGTFKGMGMSGGAAATAGGIAAMAATTAAVVAWGFAIDQGVKLYDETVGVEMRFREELIEKLKLENAEREKLLVDMRKRDNAQQNLLRLGEHLAAVGGNQAGRDVLNTGQDFGTLAKQGWTTAEKGENIGTTSAGADNMVGEFTQAFKMAQESHNQETVNQALKMLQSSKFLQMALVQSGLDVDGGFGALLEAAEKGGEQFKGMAKGLKALIGNGKLDPSKMGVNIGGGNTFNIKQEFREADPDRVMTVFKGGIAKAALGRLSARVSTPFGGF